MSLRSILSKTSVPLFVIALSLVPSLDIAADDRFDSEGAPHIASESDPSETGAGAREADISHSFLVGTLLYLPNRIFDIFDIFRIRLRAGPGIAAGIRATKVVELYAGTYASVYAGLPGPRMKQTIPLPIGLESHNGVSASLLDATADGGIGPDYSPTEIGAGVQLAILGIDIGFDPLEIVDFAAGIFTIDPRDDDF